MASHPSGWGAFAISGGVYFASDGRGVGGCGHGAGRSVGCDTSVSDVAGDVIRGADGRRIGGRRIRNKTQGTRRGNAGGVCRRECSRRRPRLPRWGVLPSKCRVGVGVRGQIRAYKMPYVKSGRGLWSTGHGKRASRLGVCRGAPPPKGVLPFLDMCDYRGVAYHAL